ncbi:fatty acyl-CoA reductase 3-like [Typha angustifolia]|uniref:fatty acyl-CoA reductase 3-like n=1 Tax=Typha angustifolia TaxID=59011 RepID=UPI003C2C8957
METYRIAGYFKNKCILITGSTGFLAKIFVEKILRAQPDVKKLFLLVRASDATSAKQRVQNEVIGKELFTVLEEKHGRGFHSFIEAKVFPVAGDIVRENLGIEDSILTELWKDIDFVVNVAATTSFNERYDVAMNVNVLGAKNVLEFAKRCAKAKMLLHVSTAYVAGEREGLIPEKPFSMGETLNGNSHLDIQEEINFVQERKKELQANKPTERIEKITMKELGMKRARHFGWPNTYVFTKAMGEMLLGHLRGDLPLVIIRPTIITSIYKDPLPGWMEKTRTIDSFIIGYAKGKLTCSLGNPKLTMDVIPGDMVVNAMIVAMAAYLNNQSEIIYHVSSSMRNPVAFSILQLCVYQYFSKHPRTGKNGKTIKTRKVPMFRNLASFRTYMVLRYKLPLEVLHLLDLILCRSLSHRCNELRQMYNFIVRLAELYAPYTFFKGCFEDINSRRLWMAMMKDNTEEIPLLDFDLKSIDWEDYFNNIHIPGVLKHLCN